MLNAKWRIQIVFTVLLSAVAALSLAGATDKQAVKPLSPLPELTRINVGQSGLSLLVPSNSAFRETIVPVNGADEVVQNRRFVYENNGVKFTVQYLRYAGTMTAELDSIIDAVVENVQNQSSFTPVQVVQAPVNVPQLQGRRISATYKLPPFDKEMHYEVSALVDGPRIWALSASYKECDVNGQNLVTTMLKSLRYTAPP